MRVGNLYLVEFAEISNMSRFRFFAEEYFVMANSIEEALKKANEYKKAKEDAEEKSILDKDGSLNLEEEEKSVPRNVKLISSEAII